MMFNSTESGLKTKVVELREALSSQLLIWDRHGELGELGEVTIEGLLMRNQGVVVVERKDRQPW